MRRLKPFLRTRRRSGQTIRSERPQVGTEGDRVLDLELFGTCDKRCCGLICAGDVGGGDGAAVDR